MDDPYHGKQRADAGPNRSLPPLSVNDMNEDGHPAERHENSPTFESEDPPVHVNACGWVLTLSCSV